MKRVVAAGVAAALVVLAAVSAIPGVALGDAAAPPRAPRPTATASNGAGAPGDTVEVIGKGWPAQTIVQVQLCGNLNLNGSVDCLRSGAVTKAADDDGSFAATLVIGMPPAPCPCVISIATFDGRFPLDLPYEVTGAPTKTPTKAESKVPEFELVGTRVVDDPSLGSRFGLADTRTIATAVRNTGSTPIAELPLTVTYGRGADPSRVVAVRVVRDLEPGERRTLRIPIHTSALSAGTSTAVVTVGTGGRAVDDSVTLSSFPWFLAILITVLAIVLLVLLFSRLTRSRRAGPPAPLPPPPPGGGLDPQALERDLADQLQDALLVAQAEGGSPAVVAAQVAPTVAASVAARHHLRDAEAAALAAGLEESLRVQLAGAAAALPPPPVQGVEEVDGPSPDGDPEAQPDADQPGAPDAPEPVGANEGT